MATKPTIDEARAARLGPEAVKRVELPTTGGWWCLNTRPSWGRLMNIRKTMSSNGHTEEDNINLILMELTTEWSFSDDITVEAIERMDIEDVGAIMEEVNTSVLPLFERMVKS